MSDSQGPQDKKSAVVPPAAKVAAARQAAEAEADLQHVPGGLLMAPFAELVRPDRLEFKSPHCATSKKAIRRTAWRAGSALHQNVGRLGSGDLVTVEALPTDIAGLDVGARVQLSWHSEDCRALDSTAPFSG